MKRELGYTLAEVLISMMLTAVLVGAVFSIAISTQQSSNKVDRRVVSNQYSRHMSELLAEYVSGDITTTNLKIAGPTSTGPGLASWYLTGANGEDGRSLQDDCGSCGIAGDCHSGSCTFPSNCYALSQTTHTIKQFLPAWFENAPYNACISYYVAPTGVGQSYSLTYGGSAKTANQANVSVNWTEP